MIDYKTASKDQLKAEMKRLASVVSDTLWSQKEFFHLPEILNSGEQPVAMQRNDGWQHMANNPY